METRLMSRERLLPLDDFLRSTEPAYKESRLLPFWEEIRTARSRKYTLAQIRQWLAHNGVDITIQGLSRFIIVQTTRDGHRYSSDAEGPKPTPNNSASPVNPNKRKDQREQTAAQFIREDTNSVLNIIEEKAK
jgi:hypothetical protein